MPSRGKSALGITRADHHRWQSRDYSLRNRAILLVLVPASLLVIPHKFEVLVKVCELIITTLHVKPASIPNGTTCSSSLSLPPLISPTSNAIHPPFAVTRASSRNTAPMTRAHSATVFAIVIRWLISSKSRQLNQQRSQLSEA